jgi:hypothetical protein
MLVYTDRRGCFLPFHFVRELMTSHTYSARIALFARLSRHELEIISRLITSLFALCVLLPAERQRHAAK